MMNRLMSKGSLFLFALLFSLNVVAQDVRSAFDTDNAVLTMQIDVDKQKLIAEDAEREKQGMPQRTSLLFPVDASMKNVGKWETLKDGSTSWVFTIKVPESEGVILYFKEFYIPQGAELYVYSEEAEVDTKYYTHESNQKGGFYYAETRVGSEITLEYIVSKDVKEDARIHITDVGFKYNSMYSILPSVNGMQTRLNNLENTCIPNINCAEYVDWKKQKKGVMLIKMRTASAGYSCTGTLINNTEKDKKPYVLTAYHCFYNLKGEDAIIPSTMFVFDYEFEGCENQRLEPEGKTLVGAKALVMLPIEGKSDGALLEIDDKIKPEMDVYYNGWDIYNPQRMQTTGAVIQHPHGDVKKIAIYQAPLRTTQWNGADGSLGARGAHWRVNYTTGVTQGGSSGSPLFNAEGLIVGTLSGGSTSCKSPNADDLYGKLAYHWDMSNDPTQHMKKYLDPKNTGATKLEGMDKDGGVVIPPTEEIANMQLAWTGANLTVQTELPITKVRVISQAGHQIYESSAGMKTTFAKHDIPAAGWLSGLYIITVWVEGGAKHTQKIMK